MLNVIQLEDDVWCNLKNNRDGNSVGHFVQDCQVTGGCCCMQAHFDKLLLIFCISMLQNIYIIFFFVPSNT